MDQPNEKNQNRDPERYPPGPVDAREIVALRERLGLTQRQFAGWFGFPVATLRHWERGNRRPAGPGLVLLEVIRDNPRAVLLAVRKARTRNPEGLAKIEMRKSCRAPPGFGGGFDY
jgi:putative transcriptional regulator